MNSPTVAAVYDRRTIKSVPICQKVTLLYSDSVAMLSVVKSTLILPVFLLVLASTAKDDFVWPHRLFPLDSSKGVELNAVLPHVFNDETGKVPTKFSVNYIDLKGDGQKDVIAYLGPDGQTTDYGIFRKVADHWENLGFFMGGCIFCSKANGYYQLEVGGDYRGGNTWRGLLRFVHGRYRMVREEQYERGVLTGAQYNADGLPDTEVETDGVHSIE